MGKTNYWKVGLFVVSTFVLAVAALFWLAARRLNREVYPAVTYFDESVQGLDIGAAVKMRGVTIGSVNDISFAPGGRLVEVQVNIFSDVMERLGFGFLEEHWETAAHPDGLRAQLVTSGITGIKLLSVDYFEPEAHPPMELGFQPKMHYLPSTTSTLKTLEEGVNEFLFRAPRLMEKIEELAVTSERSVRELDTAALSERLLSLMERIEGKLEGLDLEKVVADGAALLADARVAAVDLRELVHDLRSEEGSFVTTLKTLERSATRLDAAIETADLGGTVGEIRATAGAYRQLAERSGETIEGLRDDLREFRSAMAALRTLAAYLERDPGALLRGRTGGQ